MLGSLDVGLDVARGHQPHGMTELRQLARPVMGGRARFHAGMAGSETLDPLRAPMGAVREAPRHEVAVSVAPPALSRFSSLTQRNQAGKGCYGREPDGRRPKAVVEFEDWAGPVAWGQWRPPCFPSPLIEPEVPISAIGSPTGFTARHTTGAHQGRRSRQYTPRSHYNVQRGTGWSPCPATLCRLTRKSTRTRSRRRSSTPRNADSTRPCNSPSLTSRADIVERVRALPATVLPRRRRAPAAVCPPSPPAVARSSSTGLGAQVRFPVPRDTNAGRRRIAKEREALLWGTSSSRGWAFLSSVLPDSLVIHRPSRLYAESLGRTDRG